MFCSAVASIGPAGSGGLPGLRVLLTEFAAVAKGIKARAILRGPGDRWRPEARAGNWSDVTKNSENYASEIPHRLANSRECRAYFCEPDIACRDRERPET